jgi:hypothetical protein
VRLLDVGEARGSFALTIKGRGGWLSWRTRPDTHGFQAIAQVHVQVRLADIQAFIGGPGERSRRSVRAQKV